MKVNYDSNFGASGYVGRVLFREASRNEFLRFNFENSKRVYLA